MKLFRIQTKENRLIVLVVYDNNVSCISFYDSQISLIS